MGTAVWPQTQAHGALLDSPLLSALKEQQLPQEIIHDKSCARNRQVLAKTNCCLILITWSLGVSPIYVRDVDIFIGKFFETVLPIRNI